MTCKDCIHDGICFYDVCYVNGVRYPEHTDIEGVCKGFDNKLNYNKSLIGGEKRRKYKMDNQYYIVRSDKAGLFFGKISSRNGDEVTMTHCRRLWYWDGACSDFQLATDGTKAPDNCKFTVWVNEITILGVTEIIPATARAVESIKAVREWKR